MRDITCGNHESKRIRLIHKSMAESINREELTVREEEIKKEGEKNTFLLMVRRLKGRYLKIIFVKVVAKRLRNVTHFTLIKHSIVKC